MTQKTSVRSAADDFSAARTGRPSPSLWCHTHGAAGSVRSQQASSGVRRGGGEGSSHRLAGFTPAPGPMVAPVPHSDLVVGLGIAGRVAVAVAGAPLAHHVVGSLSGRVIGAPLSAQQDDAAKAVLAVDDASLATLHLRGQHGLGAAEVLVMGRPGSPWVSESDEGSGVRDRRVAVVGGGASSPSEDYLTVLAGQRQWIATTNFAGCAGRPPDSFANSAVLTTSAKVPDALG